jgi:hypothetical protein
VGCGAPVETTSKPAIPTVAQLQPDATFTGTRALLVQLAAKAVLQIGWKLDSAEEQSGLVRFTTGVSWGSWAGVSGSIYLEDLGGNRFRPAGTAKQNVRGNQIALNLFSEAENKVQKIVETMRSIVLAKERETGGLDDLSKRSTANVRASGKIKDVTWTYFDEDFYVGERGDVRKRFATIDDLKNFFGV